MKKLFTFAGVFLLAAALAVSCKNEEVEKEAQYLTVTPESLSIPAMETATRITVACDLPWTASLEETPWAEFYLPDGKTDYFYLRTQPNLEENSRTGTLVLKAGKTELRKQITQEGLSTFFTPRSIRLTGTKSATVSYPVTTLNSSFSTPDITWLNVKKSTADGRVTLTVSAKDKNESLGDREGVIRVAFGSYNVDIPVAQGQTDVILVDGNTSLSLEWTAQNLTLVTHYNVEYGVSVAADWIHHDIPKAALLEGTEEFSLDENPSTESRTGQIRFTAKSGEPSITVTLIQAGKDPILTVNTPGIYGFNGADYIFAADGWNQSSFITEADGSIRWRLLNAGSLSLLTLTGARADAVRGEATTLHLNFTQKGHARQLLTCTATLLDTRDGYWWYKVNGNTYFIIRKEVAL